MLKWATILLVILQSCSNQSSGPKEPILATAFGKKLVYSDIDSNISNRFNGEDSLGFLQQYVNSWVEQEALLEKAKHIATESKVDHSQQIESYRKSLLMHDLRVYLTAQKVDTIVSDQEIEDYYTKHPDDFQLRNNIVKIRYAHVPQGAPKQGKLTYYLKNPSDINDSLLNLYCNKHAINHFFDDEWLYFNDIIKIIPIEPNYNQTVFLKGKNFHVFQENATKLYLYIKNFRIKNDLSPLSFEKERVKRVILTQRQIKRINELEKEIVDKEIANGNIKIHIN